MQTTTDEKLKIQNPSTTSDLERRDHLLASSLRDHQLDWQYRCEYPLVLTEKSASTSWCLYSGENIAAHASLWPRMLSHRSGQRAIKLGFIGNVATDSKYRGCGFMTKLFSHLIEVARSHDIEALVLWSDLLQFYQKLGFSSIGRESRFTFKPKDTQLITGITRVSPDSLTDLDLERMLDLRPKFEWNLGRTVPEFRVLLSIPNTALLIRRHGSRIVSWMAIGRGSDMQGIVHEWGSASGLELVRDIQAVIAQWDLPELQTIAPAGLTPLWQETLKLYSVNQADCPMALGLPIGPKGAEALAATAKSFIWGFDSI